MKNFIQTKLHLLLKSSGTARGHIRCAPNGKLLRARRLCVRVPGARKREKTCGGKKNVKKCRPNFNRKEKHRAERCEGARKLDANETARKTSSERMHALRESEFEKGH